MPQEFYKEEDAEAILRLASQGLDVGAVSRANLLASAAELGISVEALEQAERSVMFQRADSELRSQFKRRVHGEFYTHLVVYLTVNLFLIAINALTGLQDFWAIWPILGWGLAVALHCGVIFVKSPDAFEREFERWKEKRKSRHRREGLTIGVSIGGKTLPPK
jgi:hypothetical protein